MRRLKFKIAVYMDDGTTNSLIATLYMKQDAVDDASGEGVTVMANTGLNNVHRQGDLSGARVRSLKRDSSPRPEARERMAHR